MKAVVQRVLEASVSVNHQIIGSIKKGYLILLGIRFDDTEQDVLFLSRKIANLRIFEDENNKLNRSIKDVSGSILSISQFTLYGDTSDGNRPSFSEAAKPEVANPLYALFNQTLSEKHNIPVSTGIFGSDMTVHLVNDGPCTIILESRK